MLSGIAIGLQYCDNGIHNAVICIGACACPSTLMHKCSKSIRSSIVIKNVIGWDCPLGMGDIEDFAYDYYEGIIPNCDRKLTTNMSNCS